jgi:hypothetical protein
VPDAAQLKAMEARFAPVDVRVDVSYLPAEERARARAADRSVEVYRRAVRPAALAGQRVDAVAIAGGRHAAVVRA